MSILQNVRLLLALALVMTVFQGFRCEAAQMNREDQSVKPVLDVPLRDPSVCRGPDGTYYLTGTLSEGDRGTDFHNNPGIKVWKSADMETWEEVGLVWDLSEDPDVWQMWGRMWHNIPETPDSPLARGVQAPEIHYLRDTFWIAYSMNGQGTALLRSTSGEAEGPYEQVGRITTRGGHASMFEDEGGMVYWVWGEGWIAKMRDDMRGLAEPPRLLRPDPGEKHGMAPLRVGASGAFLFKHAGKYHLTCADYTERLGGSACHDTFVASADDIFGPYSPRRLMVPHGGPTTVFHDGDGGLHATFCGDDRFAMFRDRAGTVPLYYDGFLKHVRKATDIITESGPVARLQPIELPGDYGGIRDPQILCAPDGYYYLTGTTGKQTLHVPGCRLWRSRDLENWEALGDEHGVVWYVDQAEWTEEPFEVGAVGHPVHDFWAPEIHYVNGNYYIPFCMFGGGFGLLRSASGEAEGPWESVGRLGDGGDPTIFVDDDGTPYMVWSFGIIRIAEMKPDMSGFAEKPTPIFPGDGGRMGYEGAYLAKMRGKYVLFHTGTYGEPDAERKGRQRYHQYGTYDFMYCTADDVKGPYSEPRLVVPHGGHTCVFRDGEDRWWSTFFGTDMTAPFRGKLGLVPLNVELRDGDLIIEPVPEHRE